MELRRAATVPLFAAAISLRSPCRSGRAARLERGRGSLIYRTEDGGAGRSEQRSGQLSTGIQGKKKYSLLVVGTETDSNRCA